MLMKKLVAGAGVSTLALALSVAAAYAQETTGGIRGQVTDTNGRPVANATVVVTHTPTGTRATSVTGADGFYSTRGLRVGGPYAVSATATDYETENTQIDQIGVGDAAALDLVLEPASAAVEELVVTAGAPPSDGSTRFTTAQIEALPSLNRDLKDFARINPFATLNPENQNAISFGGVNTRFNQLTVDGVRQNDDFGLNNNGYPTQRSPVSLEAVEAVSVSAAPFSVSNDGFLGGSINVVTKSGTNRFTGSAFYEKTGREWQGDTVRGLPAGAAFEERTWGATLGGPIWKDRIFFFGSYEKYKGQFSLDEGPFDLGLPISIPRISTQAIAAFQTAAKSIYGYDPGSYVSSAPPVTDEKIRARIDWNITDNHRATFSFQRTDGNSFNGSTSSIFVGGDSQTQPRVGLESSQYNKHEVLDSYTAQLNSEWTSNFSTELRYNFKEVDTTQIPLNGLAVGQTEVTVNDLTGVAAGAGSAQIRFGADTARHDNYLNTKVQTIEGIARYRLGAHDLVAGIRTETDEMFNVFLFNALGSYTFSSFANFQAKIASGFSLSGAVADPAAGTVAATLGTARNAAAELKYRHNSIYAEDNWQVTDDLRVQVGLRYNWYSSNDTPPLNTAFVSRHGFENTATIDGRSILLPRISFDWNIGNGMSLTGGVGRFSNTGLNVWLTNPIALDGVRTTNAVCPAGPYTNVDITKAPAGCTFTPGNGNTNALDPDFKIPSVWKASLSYTYRFDAGRFGRNWLLQGDVLYQVNDDALQWYDQRARIIGAAPDGRPVYGRTTTGTTGANQFDMMLTNADKGMSRSLSGTLGKDWDDGWAKGLSLRATYTTTRATDANPMTSSQALSSFVRFASSSHNSPAAATSDYEMRNRFSMLASYNRKFFRDNETVFTIFAQRRSGLPFSYVFANSGTSGFDNDFGEIVTSYSGRQVSSAQLLYVPRADSNGNVTATSDPVVVYGPGFDVGAFNTILQNTGLIDYAGGIAPRNGFRGRSITTVDIHLSQELPVFFPRGAKILAYFDILNFGNLLNDKWGVLDQYDFYRGVSVVDVTCGAAAGSCALPGARYTYQALQTEPGQPNKPRQPFVVNNGSLWQLKAGVKFRF